VGIAAIQIFSFRAQGVILSRCDDDFNFSSTYISAQRDAISLGIFFQWVSSPKNSGKHICYTWGPDLLIEKIGWCFYYLCFKIDIRSFDPSCTIHGVRSKNFTVGPYIPLSNIQNHIKFRKIVRRETEDTNFFRKYTRVSVSHGVRGVGAHPFQEKFFTRPSVYTYMDVLVSG